MNAVTSSFTWTGLGTFIFIGKIPTKCRASALFYFQFLMEQECDFCYLFIYQNYLTTKAVKFMSLGEKRLDLTLSEAHFP